MVIPSPACADHAPRRAVDDDRRPDRGVDVVATEYLGDAAAPLLCEIESRRASRAKDAGIHAVAIERQTHAGAEDLRALAANREDRDFVLILVAGQADLSSSEQLAHLGDDGIEHRSGRGSLGDERRDPAQRGLLFREFASPRFRGGEFLAHGGVGDRRCNELSEASEPFLRVRKESLVRRRADVDGAPDGSIDNDRDADRVREARLTRHGVKSAGSSELVDAHGLAGSVDRGGETGNVERQAATGWERRWGRGRLRGLKRAQDQDGVGFVAAHRHVLHAEYVRNLLRHGREHRFALCSLGHERGHPPQRRLLVG